MICYLTILQNIKPIQGANRTKSFEAILLLILT